MLRGFTPAFGKHAQITGSLDNIIILSFPVRPSPLQTNTSCGFIRHSGVHREREDSRHSEYSWGCGLSKVFNGLLHKWPSSFSLVTFLLNGRTPEGTKQVFDLASWTLSDKRHFSCMVHFVTLCKYTQKKVCVRV